MLVVDSQIHLFSESRRAQAERGGHRILDPAGVISSMDAAGVDRAYLVPSGSASNDTCVQAARSSPDRFRVMGIVPLDRPSGKEMLARWEQTGMHGVRLRFPAPGDASWLRNGTADWFWPQAEQLGIPLMVWPPGQLQEIAIVAERYPRLRITIDHLGLFVSDRDEKVAEVTDDLIELSRLDNIAVKASALPHHSTDPYPYRNLHAPLAKVVDAFGARRVFFGSDLTRIQCPYQKVVDLFVHELEFLSDADIEQIMGRAVTEWIGW